MLYQHDTGWHQSQLFYRSYQCCARARFIMSVWCHSTNWKLIGGDRCILRSKSICHLFVTCLLFLPLTLSLPIVLFVLQWQAFPIPPQERRWLTGVLTWEAEDVPSTTRSAPRLHPLRFLLMERESPKHASYICVPDQCHYWIKCSASFFMKCCYCFQTCGTFFIMAKCWMLPYLEVILEKKSLLNK